MKTTFQLYEKAEKFAGKLLNKMVKENRRSLDPLAARVYFYHSRVYELVGKAEEVRRFDTLTYF